MFEKIKQVFVGSQAPTEVNYDEASCELQGGKALLLDVRELEEWQHLRIPHAKHIPLGQLEKCTAELSPDKNVRIICHCKSGRRSLVARDILLKQGFTNVSSLHGGILEWKNKGGAVEGVDSASCGCC